MGLGNGARPAFITAAAVGAAAGAAACAWARRRDAHLVRTAAGFAAVYTAEENVRVLRAGGVFQSATYLDERRFEPVFEYYRGFDAMFESETPLASTFGHGVTEVLMLGGGGFAYPKHLLSSRSGISLDVVEIDPAVVDAARRWFFLDELEERLASSSECTRNRLRVFIADARSFIEGADDDFEVSLPEVRDAAAPLACSRGFERYDAIVNDCFHGSEPVRALATYEAMAAVHRRLVPGGLYLANVVSRDGGSDLSFLRDVAATLSLVFRRVHILPCADEEFGGEDNYLVIATDADVEFADAIPFDADFLGSPMRD